MKPKSMTMGILFRWIQYLFLLAVLFAAYIFYYSYYLLILLVFFLMLPFLSYFFAKQTVAAVSLGIAMDKHECSVGEKERVRILVNNRSRFAAVNLYINFQMENAFHPNEEWYRVNVPVYGSGTLESVWELTSIYTGKIDICLREWYLQDILGLFLFRRSCQERESLYVLPELTPLSFDYSQDNVSMGDGEDAINRRGDDSSEILEIREYRAGDRIQRVHWKLTAKNDTLMVKEYGEFASRRIRIFIFLAKEWTQELEAILQCAYSVCGYLTRSGETFTLGYIGKDGYAESESVREFTRVQVLFEKIYQTPLHAVSEVQSLSLDGWYVVGKNQDALLKSGTEILTVDGKAVLVQC